MNGAKGTSGVSPGDAARLDAGLFAVSAAVLTLEILQTRIFSYSLNQITIYLAIGVCMLGLGASATVLAALPAMGAARARRVASASAAAGALAVPISHAVFAQGAISLTETSLLGFVTLVALILPYLGFGTTIALLMVARSAAIGRAYGFNLAGSGFGCLVVFPLLDALGAERAALVVAGAALLAALLIRWPESRRSFAGVATVAALLLVAAVTSDRFFAFPPDPMGQLGLVQKLGSRLQAQRPGTRFDVEHLHSRWDRTGRIDVYRIDTSIPEIAPRVGVPIETRMIVQDSTAGSFLLGVGDDLARGRGLFDETVYAAGYSLGPVSDVLIMGLGGGPDVLSALYNHAKRVVGVEINESMISVVRDLYGDFQGHPYERPGVEIERMDGRSFLESTDESFDLIQMSSVDTKTLVASGALALTNSYLYTEEAVAAMLRRLRPDGVLAITRFGLVPSYRQITTIVAGLESLGAVDPARHVMVIGQGRWRAILVKPRPFDADEVERVHSWVEERSALPQVVVPSFAVLNVRFEEPMSILYSPQPRPVAREPFLQALAQDRLADFVSASPLDITAPTDDRPFFFFFERIDSLLASFPETLRHLFGIALRMALVAALFIGAPLLVMQRRGLRGADIGRSLAYFTCIGLGFMLIEIGLIHRFVLFLGHQSYAVSVVLFGILVGASLGSISSSRLSIGAPGPARLVLAGVAIAGVAYAYAIGPIFSAAVEARFAARLGVALLLLIPLGFCLGIPFPLALRSLRERSLSLVAWAIGVNALASVVGSTVAVPVAMITGLQVVLLAGAGFYALAALAVPIRRSSARSDPKETREW